MKAPAPSRARWKDLARIILGWCFIVLGLLGLFLPILQGLLFLAIGLWLLAPHVPFFHRLQHRLHTRHPRLKKRIRRIRARAKRLSFRAKQRGNHNAHPTKDLI